MGRVEQAKASIEEDDELEVPDEFLDPLMATCELQWMIRYTDKRQ
jgi:hypothetical protein